MKIAFVLFWVLSFTKTNAQDSTKAFQFWYERNLPFAKQAVDEWAATEGSNQAVCQLLKARIYNEIATNPIHKDLASDANTEALLALKTANTQNNIYVLDELMADNFALSTSIYNNYIAEAIQFYNGGIETRNTEYFQKAVADYKKAFTYNSYRKQQGWGFQELDTISYYHAAKAAIKANNSSDALLFCQKLTTNNLIKSSTTNFESIWQWQLYYYLKQKDESSFFAFATKYEEVIPKSAFAAKAKIEWFYNIKNITGLLNELKLGATKFPKEIKPIAKSFCNKILNKQVKATKKELEEAKTLRKLVMVIFIIYLFNIILIMV